MRVDQPVLPPPEEATGAALLTPSLGRAGVELHQPRPLPARRKAPPQATLWEAPAEILPAVSPAITPSPVVSHPDPPPPTEAMPPVTSPVISPATGAGLKARARATLAALRLLKTLEEEARPATDEEKRVLAGFTGFGVLANHIFPEPGTDHYKEGWEPLGRELAELLTPEEYESAKRSTFNAFYTSPTVMQAIYDGLARMGAPTEGHALEPGCGIGNFMGMAPPEMRFTGIEREILSGRIARALYPEQDIRIEPFQKTALPEGSVDVVVGNVPFSDLTLKWGDQKLALHDYFFAKSLDSLHEGGVLALVTSRYTLDKKDPSFREYLGEQANFLGAIRLPKGAFRQEGTEVVTDVIFLQKRGPGQEPAHAAGWQETAPLLESEAHCNRYFLDHPEMVVGDLALDRGMYRQQELTVAFPGDYEARLQAAVAQLPAGVYHGEARKLSAIAESPARSEHSVALLSRPLPPGSLLIDKEGAILTVADQAGTLEPLTYGGSALHALTGITGQRVAALIGIRDAARQVLETQREQCPEEEREAARALLNDRYDRFVTQWGPINRTTISTQKDGTIVRRQPNLTAFRDDPDVYLVMALEQYDEKTNSAAKMPIMQRDVIGPAKAVRHVETALDGLLASLNQRGMVDLALIGGLCGASPEQVVQELGSHIYYDPTQQCYVTAEEYLSGNVREKLRIAEAQAADPRVAAGIPALAEAQPDPVPPGDIDVTLGASWIPPQVIRAFVAELLHCLPEDITVRHVEKEALWQVDAPAIVTAKAEATSTYGTAERNAIMLINEALNMAVPTISRTVRVDGSERQMPDQEATLAAREKQKAIKQAFQQWIFADPERADTLTDLYNQRFNTLRLRHYDGSHLTFPDMNPEIELRPHQKDAIWRMMSSENCMLAHAVGAGKTFEMIAGGMKMKQAGLINKPLFVVPNHMLEQFSREFYQLYPNAKLLVAGKEDFTGDKRRLLTAKTASGEWDGVIMTHASFEKIGMSPAFQEEFVRGQIAEYEALLTEMKAGRDADGKRLIKRIEKQKDQWEERLTELLNPDRKDPGLTFEDLGVDHLFVDEAHLFKNLETPTKMGQVAGVQTSGSLRAFDLFMKARYLDRYGHGVTFATGTPVSNSMVEMYTMTRFLAPELLQARGIEHFDAWAAAFGDIIDTVELSPDAQSLRQHRRFARFVNLPELLQMFHSFADVKMADMLDLPRPELKGGKAAIVAVPMSPHQQRIQEALVERYERVRAGAVDPRDDNALKITTDGRKLALNARLVYPHLPEAEGKIDALVEKVYEIWQRTREDKATQMIFCDLGIGDQDGQFSVYHAVTRTLLERGVPADEVASMGDYDTDLKKARLFTKVRNGDVRVLLGSTQKMGTGTNVQHRLIALHHLDAPWKPAEVEQREGRILRQGNQHEEVEIYRYVTEGSFDAYMWQTLQTKAEFISQVMKGDMSVRRMEDKDEQTLSYAEVKAIASGNPAVLTLAKMEMEAQRLTQLARAHKNEQFRLRQSIRQMADAELPMLEMRAERLDADIACVEAHGGFTSPQLVVEGESITEPQKARERLREALEWHWEQLALRLESAPSGETEQAALGSFGGLEIRLKLEKGERLSGTLALAGQYANSRSLRGPGSDRLLEYLQELAEFLPTAAQETRDRQAELVARLDGFEARLGLPFEQESRLERLNAMRTELQALLQTDAPARAPGSEGVSAAGEIASSPRERTQALVVAFDALMKGEHPLPVTAAPPASMPADDPTMPAAPRRWTDRIRPRAALATVREQLETAF